MQYSTIEYEARSCVVAIHEHGTLMIVATCDTPEMANKICRLLNEEASTHDA
jgi:hypothetical protein